MKSYLTYKDVADYFKEIAMTKEAILTNDNKHYDIKWLFTYDQGVRVAHKIVQKLPELKSRFTSHTFIAKDGRKFLLIGGRFSIITDIKGLKDMMIRIAMETKQG